MASKRQSHLDDFFKANKRSRLNSLENQSNNNDDEDQISDEIRPEDSDHNTREARDESFSDEILSNERETDSTISEKDMNTSHFDPVERTFQDTDDEHSGTYTEEEEEEEEEEISLENAIFDTVDGISDINSLTLNSKLSIFKLNNKRIPDLKQLKNDSDEFRKIIVNVLTKNKQLKESKSEMNDECNGFHIMHFFYLNEKKENTSASQITKQRGYQRRKGRFPGERRSGNILIYFRLKQNSMQAEKEIPEAFFLCNGHAFQSILHLSDPLFRTQIAKHFMDDKKIKELDTINIAGPDIATKITYKGNTDIASQTAAYLEKAIASVSGIIKSKSKLDLLIQDDGREDVLMTVGLNFVKIGKPLSYKKLSEVLKLFSDVMTMEVDRSSCHILNALEYVHRVDDDEKRRNLEKTISGKVIDIVVNNRPTDDYFLSHRYIRDWTLSSDVTLSEVLKNEDPLEIKSWYSAPSLRMVINAIHNHRRIASTIRPFMEKKQIMLSYMRQNGIEKHPLQDFVHGFVNEKGGTYFKIGQKWFFLSSTFSQVIDRNFAFMSKCILNDRRILELVEYPWRTTRNITVSDVTHFLGTSVSKDDVQTLLELLTKEYALIDENDHCCFTKYSCLLPQSSELYQELKATIRGDGEVSKKKQKQTPSDKLQSICRFLKPHRTTPESLSETAVDRNTSYTRVSVATACTSDTNTSANQLVTSASLGSDISNSSRSDNNTTDGFAPRSTSPNVPTSANNDSASVVLGGDNLHEASFQAHENTEEMEAKIGSMLLNYLIKDEKIKDKKMLTVLRKKRQICVKKDTKYLIRNAVLTKKLLMEVNQIAPSLDESELLNFLRSMNPLTEGEYNELYLNCKQNDHFTVFPGDRILANNVELFDVLIYDHAHHVTYLFHNKDGLNNHTRDACAQIRNASELLWHDVMRGQRNHIELFWNSAVNSTTAESPYRQFLREKLNNLGKDKFMMMFDDNAKIVFVLAFVIFHAKGTPKLNWKFKAITLQDFIDEKLNKETMTFLQNGGFLTESGYLTDIFIGMTQEKFVETCKSVDGLKNLTIKRLKKVYKFLCKLGTCQMSTIAKLELLTLDGCFARYQTGGERRFELKLLQLNST